MMEMLNLRIPKQIKELIRKISMELGLTPSEYVRECIINDLERKSLITTKLQKLKEEMIKSE